MTLLTSSQQEQLIQLWQEFGLALEKQAHSETVVILRFYCNRVLGRLTEPELDSTYLWTMLKRMEALPSQPKTPTPMIQLVKRLQYDTFKRTQ